MDQFGQHAEAARLLAAAARLLRDRTLKVRKASRNQSSSRQVTALSQDLLNLLRFALHSVAAAYDTCQLLEQRTRRTAKPSPARRTPRTRKPRAKTARRTSSRQ